MLLIFHLAFFLLALVAPFLPVFLAWRSITLSLICLTLANFLDGPTHWSSQNVGHALGQAYLYLFLISIFFILVLRFGILVYRDRLDSETLMGPRDRVYRIIDQIILSTFSVFLAFLIVQILAEVLADGTGGKFLDLGIAFIAVIATIGIVYFFLKTKGSAPAIIFFSGVAAMSTYGSFQTERILSQATTLAGNLPWCLASSATKKPISDVGQLGFFSLPKGISAPHLNLLIRYKNDDSVYYWSIRQQQFITSRTPVGATCHPRSDFLEALRHN